jgi:hypothetical protein
MYFCGSSKAFAVFDGKMVAETHSEPIYRCSLPYGPTFLQDTLIVAFVVNRT